MQASQASKAADENEEVPKTRSVPKSKKQSRKKLATRAKGKRRLEKVALSKKAMKRSKQKVPKSMEVSLSEVAEITRATEPHTAEKSSTSIEASARQGRKRPGAKPKEVNEDDSKVNILGAQMSTAEKLDDIMDILDSSNNQKMPGSPVKVIRKIVPSTKSETAVMAALNELQNYGEIPEVSPARATAILAHFSRQVLAHLQTNPGKSSGSVHQLRVNVHLPCSSVNY